MSDMVRSRCKLASLLRGACLRVRVRRQAGHINFLGNALRVFLTIWVVYCNFFFANACAYPTINLTKKTRLHCPTPAQPFHDLGSALIPIT